MTDPNGQADGGSQTTDNGTATTPTAPSGQANDAQTTTPATSGDGTGAAETFFDPESIKGKPELEAAYKQMQAAFTKRTTALKEQQQKVEAYDAFTSNPLQTLQQLAAQYGYSLSRGQAQAMLDNAQGQQGQQGQQSFEPKTWEEVLAAAEQRALQSVMQRISPFLSEVKETRKGQLEQMLDSSAPDWRVYEDAMTENLAKHPSLANDPVMLYRLSVPPEVLESRAAQAAIKKLQDKATAAQISGGSSTTQTASERPKGKLSFNDAVETAKRQLAAKGLKPMH